MSRSFSQFIRPALTQRTHTTTNRICTHTRRHPSIRVQFDSSILFAHSLARILNAVIDHDFEHDRTDCADTVSVIFFRPFVRSLALSFVRLHRVLLDAAYVFVFLSGLLTYARNSYAASKTHCASRFWCLFVSMKKS